MGSEMGGLGRLVAVVLAVAAYLALSGWLLVVLGARAAAAVLLCGALFGTGVVVLTGILLRCGLLEAVLGAPQENPGTEADDGAAAEGTGRRTAALGHPEGGGNQRDTASLGHFPANSAYPAYIPPGYVPPGEPRSGHLRGPGPQDPSRRSWDRPGNPVGNSWDPTAGPEGPTDPQGPLAAPGAAPAPEPAPEPDRAPAATRPPTPDATQDPAWPVYGVSQWRTDLMTLSVTSIRFVARRCWRAHRWLAARPRLLWIWPLPAAGYLALPGIAVGLLAALAATAVITTVAVGVGWVLGGAAAGVLVSLDRVLQRLRKSQASCPECYTVTSRPAFRCPGCGQLHRRLAPGRLGVFHRRCTCGRILPTTVRRASRRLVAVCPNCRVARELPRGAGNLTDIRIPVFGPVSAGKSRLIMAGLVDLAVVARAAGVEMEFVDESSRKSFGQMKDVMSMAVATIPKTQESVRPRPCTVTLTAQRRQALVHLFDAAGERYVRRDRNADLAYLDEARTLVFVLDPFSIPSVRAVMTGALGEVLRQAWAAEHDPQEAYNATATRLQDFGVLTRRQRLAFVVSKADLLLGLPFAEDLGSDELSVKAWLERQGLDRLLRCAERDFGTVRYFLVSSLRADPGGDMSAARPLLWLMGTDGFEDLEETDRA
ncbi:MAG: hypothetical protein QG608_1415 [Actinomycetota bacterium]|nr:hypothetical protein [Actinomycetota bacterium]